MHVPRLGGNRWCWLVPSGKVEGSIVDLSRLLLVLLCDLVWSPML